MNEPPLLTQMPEPDEPGAEHELMTADELAELLRITPEALRGRLERGTIPAECISPVKPRRFVTVAVRRWLGLEVAS